MAKGRKTGGRKPGVPNKATRDVRQAIARFAETTVEDFTRWVGEIEDPAKRCDVFLRALEYHVPKLARSELTGANGGPVQYENLSDEQLEREFQQALAEVRDAMMSMGTDHGGSGSPGAA